MSSSIFIKCLDKNHNLTSFAGNYHSHLLGQSSIQVQLKSVTDNATLTISRPSDTRITQCTLCYKPNTELNATQIINPSNNTIIIPAFKSLQDINEWFVSQYSSCITDPLVFIGKRGGKYMLVNGKKKYIK